MVLSVAREKIRITVFFWVRNDVFYDLFLWFWKVSGWVPGASGRGLESFPVSAGGPEVNLSGHEEISDDVGDDVGKTIPLIFLKEIFVNLQRTSCV